MPTLPGERESEAADVELGADDKELEAANVDESRDPELAPLREMQKLVEGAPPPVLELTGAVDSATDGNVLERAEFLESFDANDDGVRPCILLFGTLIELAE